MSITASNPAGMAVPASSYSQTVRVYLGDAVLLFVSGQGPEDAAGQTVGAGDAAAQAERVFANIAAAMAAHGGTLRDVVKLTVFVTDIAHREAVNGACTRFFPASPPASTLVEVNRLAVDAWVVEIEAVAVIRP